MKTFFFFILTTINAFYQNPIIRKTSSINLKKFHLDPFFKENLIKQYNDEILKNYITNNLYKFPETEEEIEENSFENYLRNHFYIICDKNQEISFNTFYKWRTNVGTLLNVDELYNIFHTMTKPKQTCNLIEFLKINIIIDENDDIHN